ncbi:hypothetical protein E4T66_02080 [Sinimarinibacterium sp. CAU 1509]|uniref:hypothetical protein n=1 Tax=Sinimarinibacterium sp. CAU 1509 TaxID=2562283 RepID=UPI0010ACFDE9|nr:hypothetical protein [Sinimarinibacterium sp. CAU 1509]TJY65032.1 hypothetical protein E4T66_02080 [Sinimarinibacterium sp. CAU 1509]
MDHSPTDTQDTAARGRLRLLMHGALIAIIGLLSGFGFVFVILEAISVWPITIDAHAVIPGSERGWRVAHVAGVMNGLMMMIAGLALPHIHATRRAQAWIVWGMVYTGWGNTIFFHCANLSNNRGLSAGITKYGEADWLGTIGYLVGASTIPFTIAALALIGVSALRLLRNR